MLERINKTVDDFIVGTIAEGTVVASGQTQSVDADR
jgi:hypothetical protein